MADNIVQQVASGNAPQPAADSAQPSDYKSLEQKVAENFSNEEISDLEMSELDTPEEIEAAKKAGDLSASQANALKKKLKLKVDGVDSEEEIDWNDEESLRKHLQKSKAFDKRMQEFSGYKSQVDMIMRMLDEDPEALLEKLGKNVDDLAEKRLRRKVEEMEKSPEQLEKDKMAKELEDLRKESKKIKEDKEKAELESMRNQHAMELERDIKSALDGSSTILPKKSPIVMHRIGQALFLAMKNGYPNVKVKDVIPIVEKQFKQELSDLFSVMPEDTIEALIGKEPLHKWRKSLIAKSRASKVGDTPVPNKQVVDTGASTKLTAEQDDANKKRFKDFFKYND